MLLTERNIMLSQDDAGGVPGAGTLETSETPAPPNLVGDTAGAPPEQEGVQPGGEAPEGAGAETTPALPEGWPEGVPYEPGDAPYGVDLTETKPGEPTTVEPLSDDHPALQKLQGELDYYRDNLDKALAQLQTVQDELRQYELAGMDEDEVARLQFQQQQEEFQKQQEAFIEAAWKRDLWTFYSQYVPESILAGAGDDPAAWQASAFNHMQQSVSTLYRENRALRKALQAKLGAAAPEVPAPGGRTAPSRGIQSMTPEEREKLYNLADRGLLDWNTIK